MKHLREAFSKKSRRSFSRVANRVFHPAAVRQEAPGTLGLLM
jgi:hypothetical protein